MKILYEESSGKIYHVVLDKDWFLFVNNTDIALSTFEIEEINPSNKDICVDLIKHRDNHKIDKDGKDKYYMQNNELYSRDGWAEYVYFPELEEI
jgi:hypothetical protein